MQKKPIDKARTFVKKSAKTELPVNHRFFPKLDVEHQLNRRPATSKRVNGLLRAMMTYARKHHRLHVFCWDRNKKIVTQCLARLGRPLQDRKGAYWKTSGRKPVVIRFFLKDPHLLKNTGPRKPHPGEAELIGELLSAYNSGGY